MIFLLRSQFIRDTLGVRMGCVLSCDIMCCFLKCWLETVSNVICKLFHSFFPQILFQAWDLKVWLSSPHTHSVTNIQFFKYMLVLLSVQWQVECLDHNFQRWGATSRCCRSRGERGVASWVPGAQFPTLGTISRCCRSRGERGEGGGTPSCH